MIDVTLALAFTGGLVATAYHRLQEGIPTGLERLLPEIAVLIIALVAFRWTISTYNASIERMSERHDQREQDFLTALNEQMEACRERDRAVTALSHNIKEQDKVLEAQTRILHQLANQTRSEQHG